MGLRRMMSFRLDDQTRTWIRLISRLEGVSGSRVVRIAVAEHVERVTGDGSGGGELQGSR